MLFLVVLTVFVAATAYRRGERWAWISLLLAFVFTFAHLIPSFYFVSSGILVNSGISVGVVGILVIFAFFVVGLLLPGTELFRKTTTTPADPSKGSRRLSFIWIYLLISLGVFNILGAIFVPLFDHISYPAQMPPTYMDPDALFTGVSWQQVISLSPTLGLWIVLQMDNMCAAMIGGGILTTAVSLKGFRHSKRWAWYALLSATAALYIPLYLISIPFYQSGFYEASAVSAGFPTSPAAFVVLILIVVTILALLIPASHFRLSKTSHGRFRSSNGT